LSDATQFTRPCAADAVDRGVVAVGVAGEAAGATRQRFMKLENEADRRCDDLARHEPGAALAPHQLTWRSWKASSSAR